MKILVKVLNFNKIDSVGDIFLSDCKINISCNPLPVLDNFDSTKPIGTAIIKRKQDGLYAMLDLKLNKKNFYPAIGFQPIEWINKNTKRIYKDIILWVIGLSNTPNEDESIKIISNISLIKSSIK